MRWLPTIQKLAAFWSTFCLLHGLNSKHRCTVWQLILEDCTAWFMLTFVPGRVSGFVFRRPQPTRRSYWVRSRWPLTISSRSYTNTYTGGCQPKRQSWRYCNWTRWLWQRTAHCAIVTALLFFRYKCFWRIWLRSLMKSRGTNQWRSQTNNYSDQWHSLTSYDTICVNLGYYK